MPLRKSPRADLRRTYVLTAQLGLLLALGAVLTAFTVPYRAPSDLALALAPPGPDEIITPIDLPPTDQRPPPPKPPAPVPVDDTTIDLPPLDIAITLDPPAPVATPPPPRPADRTEEAPAYEEPPFVPIPEVMPVLLPDQAEALRQMQACLRYPEMARRAEIEGRVFVRFVVDEAGRVTQPEVVRGIGGGTSEEALRCVQTLRFRPGLQRGRPVRVPFSLPVVFRLR